MCELHVLSALDPSDPSTVMSLVHRARVYKHFLTKILRCWQPNPVGGQVRGWSESDPRRFAREPARLAVRVHVSRSAAQKTQRHSSPRTHNSWTCTRQPTATERAGARAALRIRRATPNRCCRRWRGGSGERRRPLADQRGDAVQAAAAARDKSSSIRGAVPRLLAKVGSAHSESFAPSSHVRERTVTVPSLQRIGWPLRRRAHSASK